MEEQKTKETEQGKKEKPDSGLAMAKQAILRRNGTIEAESVEGEQVSG